MLKYEIALINVFWSSSSIDTRYHKNEEEQRAYFIGLANGKFNPVSNFPIGNNISSVISYRVDTEEDITRAVASNYAVVRECVFDANNEIIGYKNYRYYFAFCSQDSGRQLTVQLELDDIQTNYFKYKNELPSGIIKRCHLNRWIKEGNEYLFHTGVTSPFYLNEIQDTPTTILNKRTDIRLKGIDSYNHSQAYMDIYNQYLIGWLYCYVSNGTYKGQHIVGNEHIFDDYNLVDFGIGIKQLVSEDIGQYYINTVDSGVSVIVVPVTRNNYKFRIAEGDERPLFTLESLEKFLKQNEDYSRVFSIKFSPLPPFKDLTLNFDDRVSTYKYYFGVSFTMPNIITDEVSENGNACVGSYKKDEYSVPSIPTTAIDRINVELKLPRPDKETIKSQSNNLNPKVYNELINYCFKDWSGNSKILTPLELGYFDDYLEIQYYENLTPDITRYFLSPVYSKLKNSLYSDKNTPSLYGLLGSLDNSIPIANNQLSQMLAQNKNFYLNSMLNIANNFIPSISKAVSKHTFMNGRQSRLDYSSINGGVNAGLLQDVLSPFITTDNLKNAPEILKNANGNVLFNLAYSNGMLFFEEYKSMEQDITRFNDYILRYGYRYERAGNIGEFDNIRKYWNYIEFEAEVDNVPISNVERERLRKRLQSVRFWNTDKVDYSLSNYENYLDNETG